MVTENSGGHLVEITVELPAGTARELDALAASLELPAADVAAALLAAGVKPGGEHAEQRATFLRGYCVGLQMLRKLPAGLQADLAVVPLENPGMLLDILRKGAGRG